MEERRRNKKSIMWSGIAKKTFALLISAVFLSGVQSEITNVQVSAASTGVNVAYRTQEEIIAYVKQQGATTETEAIYSSEPLLTAPYKAGVFDSETTTKAIAMINQLRYVAGLGEVTNNAEYAKLAQAAAVVNYAIGRLTHTPKDDGYTAAGLQMNQDLFELGSTGAQRSNLGMGYKNLNSVILGWTSDEDDVNIKLIGHRRWLLNPQMKQTGFGQAGRYFAMYAVDGGFSDAKETGVVWPAQNMPVEYFATDYPWSISMGESVDITNVKVTMTRRNDGKTWKFSQNSSDGRLYVNNGYYGQIGAIIWEPSGTNTYNAGESYDITITGVSRPISYTVNFFNLPPSGVDISGQCTSFGNASEGISMLLSQGNEEKYKTTGYAEYIIGSRVVGSYAFEGVTAGIYTMTLSKTGHATREYDVTVSDKAVTQDVKICLYGDVDMNGERNMLDIQKIFAFIKNNATITDAYQIKLADMDENKDYNMLDIQRLFAAIKAA